MPIKPLNRLKRKLTTENLWIYILTLLKEKPMYGYEIQSEIKERFGFHIGRITSYIVLYKLKKSGYVKSKLRDSESGRIRRYYTITKKGEHLLNQGIQFLEEVLEKIKH
jgi:DNA-binding PadR family transcriptional regulator